MPVGLALGFSEVLYRASRPTIEFLRPVPSVALIPLAILVYGTGLQSKVFLVASAAPWPLQIRPSTAPAIWTRSQLETARSFRIRRYDRILRVTLMGAVPYIATGLRISSATALILSVTAELIIGSEGLGRAINVARQGGAVDMMYALIVTTGLLGWGLNSLFAAGERRVLHWHPSKRRRAMNRRALLLGVEIVTSLALVAPSGLDRRREQLLLPAARRHLRGVRGHVAVRALQR